MNLINYLKFLTHLSIINFYLNLYADPLLVVVLMVKNEESVMVDTLKPFVEAGIKDYLIFDTGSTDKTVEVTKNYFETEKITQAYIIQEPFVDFATSRNRALRLAEQYFPQAVFMLMIDAEWYIENVKELINICNQERNSKIKTYAIRLICTDVELYQPRLFRCFTDIKYEGAIHETVIGETCLLPEQIAFKVLPRTGGIEKSKARLKRDLDVLLKEYDKNNYNPRTLFYLAQTYMFLEDWENACTYYTKRIKISGYDEEDFLARYRLAYCLDNCSQINTTIPWAYALNAYLEAFSFRPTRIEPLIRIALHYFNLNDMQLAYLYAYRAMQIPFPSEDILCLERIFYDFSRYAIMSYAALKIKEYQIGELATQLALKARPDDIDLKKNLTIYSTHNSL